MPFPRGRFPRQDKEWSFIPALSQAITASGTQSGGGIAVADSRTVLRMLGSYLILPEGTLAIGDQYGIGIGIGVVSSDAFTLGSSALPDPLGEPEYPWLFWVDHQIAIVSATLIENTNSDAAVVRGSFDVRSMRKMKPQQTLAMVVQASVLAGSVDVRVMLGRTRVLFGTT